MESKLVVIGGGLAGCEAAWQAAERGIRVGLFEMRPYVSTGVHETQNLAELICSNSLGSKLTDRASGLLQEELIQMGSLLLNCALQTAVPAGRALAVDRLQFAELVTLKIQGHENIQVQRKEVRKIPTSTVVIASGPLTSPAFSNALSDLVGDDQLSFYDALAPIVLRESIDMNIAFRASRYGLENGEAGDYINCPMDRKEYNAFIDALLTAERIELHEVDQLVEHGVKAGHHRYFEGCLPIEVMAQRGRDALAFGPFRPVGMVDPRSGKQPRAVVQLRQDNLAGTHYNLVGFQTNLKYSEQERIVRMIPGLEKAQFVRYGQMHRNTFLYSPGLLQPTMQCLHRTDIFIAGQITGVEGYVGSIGTGLLAGWNAANQLNGKPLVELPRTTMLGGLCYYITHAKAEDFQPMKANFGILPSLLEGHRLGRRDRARLYSQRAKNDLTMFLSRVTPE